MNRWSPCAIVCSTTTWEHAVLVDPAGQHDLEDQRLCSLIRAALFLHQRQPNRTHIRFNLMQPMPADRPEQKLSLQLQVMDTTARDSALLITLSQERYTPNQAIPD